MVQVHRDPIALQHSERINQCPFWVAGSTGRRNTRVTHTKRSPNRLQDSRLPAMPKLRFLGRSSASAFLVRSPIRPASSSATEAICVRRNFPIGPGGTLGRSQNTRSTSLATSERSRSTLRVSRSSFAKTRLCANSLCMGKGCGELGPIRFSPALRLDVLGRDCPPSPVEIRGSRPLAALPDLSRCAPAYRLRRADKIRICPQPPNCPSVTN